MNATLHPGCVALGSFCALFAALAPGGCTKAAQTSGGRDVSPDAAVLEDGSGAALAGEAAVSGAACDVDLPASDAGCGEGRLVAATPSTITTPDPWPLHPVLAGAPDGSFLALWNDGTTGSGAIWAAKLQPTTGGVTASAPTALAEDGGCQVATWTGAGFAVIWTSGSSLRMQTLDAQGEAVGSPTTLLSGAAGMCPTALVSTPPGLAVPMTTNAPASGGEDLVTESVVFIDGAAVSTVPLDTVGPGVAGNVGVVELAGQVYAAYVEWPDADAHTTVIARIDVSARAATTLATLPGFLESFVAARGQLWVGLGGPSDPLYTAVPGAPFRLVGQGCAAIDDLAADGCGQLVGIGAAGFNPGGVAGGFYGQAFGSSGSQVSLGSMTESAVAGANATFGVLWYARVGPGGGPYDDAHPTGTLSFTTLSFE